MLRSEPSFSVYSDSADGVREEDLMMANKETLEQTVAVGGRIDAVESGEFSFAKQSDFLLIKEEDDEGAEEEDDVDDEKVEGFSGIGNEGLGEEGERGKGFNGEKELGFGFNLSGKSMISEEESPDLKVEQQGLDRTENLGFGGEEERPVSPPMHLATGLGIDKFDFNGNEIVLDLPSFDDKNCDEYHKRMLDDYPLHPLLLRSYAKFLEYNEDLHGAEDYYHRCTIVEPGNGENLVNYAKLIWRLYRDQTKALHYFECAAQASPDDSNVLAARASFLWEMDDDDGEEEAEDHGTDQFGPKGEEEKTSNSAKAETENGETMCAYAETFWEVHGDHERALFYFEKAVEASPDDCNILAACARFLWEADERDEGEAS